MYTIQLKKVKNSLKYSKELVINDSIFTAVSYFSYYFNYLYKLFFNKTIKLFVTNDFIKIKIQRISNIIQRISNKIINLFLC